MTQVSCPAAPPSALALFQAFRGLERNVVVLLGALFLVGVTAALW